MTGDELDRYLTVLETLPEARDIVRNDPHQLEQILRQPDCTPTQRERVRAILAAVGHEVKPPVEPPEHEVRQNSSSCLTKSRARRTMGGAAGIGQWSFDLQPGYPEADTPAVRQSRPRQTQILWQHAEDAKWQGATV
jgi:hypothetical protein